MVKTVKIKVKGIVQAVGFRPTVYSYAIKHFLVGFVQNKGSYVLIEVQGQENNIFSFIKDLTEKPPKNALIKEITTEEVDYQEYFSFAIKESENDLGNIYISPDIALCENCQKEFFSQKDKRYEYAFINCTDCGPRFSIIKDIPYDRKNTVMNEFQMCAFCEGEYTDPKNRRYHAEPVCCSVCGPSYYFIDFGKDTFETCHKDEAAIKKACEYLEKGEIIAIKGIGGFHISCNPYDCSSVLKLRALKHRYEKPFAVMVRNIEKAKEIAHISPFEENLLLSKEAPIVLLEKKGHSLWEDIVATDTDKIGIMMPYAPIHYLIFKYLNINALVMTSGNISGEPISYKNEEAFERLQNICSGFLFNNRDIENRIDDSVVTSLFDREYIIRRARGYVPKVFNYNSNKDIQILSCGALLKNTFSLYKENNIYMSSYIGDLEEGIAFDYYLNQIEMFKKLFKVKPDILVCDKHPDYINSLWAKEQNLPIMEVQHHVAHGLSSMAQNRLSEAICVTFDGTGYGEDGSVWGGEFFVGNLKKLERVAHFAPVSIPGVNTFLSEKISPFKCLIPYLNENDSFLKEKNLYDEYKLLKEIVPINSFMTTSVGRMFDAAASLILGIKDITFEGQAAITLEYNDDKSEKGVYDYEIINNIINQFPVFEQLKRDIELGLPSCFLSGKFHNTVADMTCKMCDKISCDTGIKQVALSGGVFQNMFLTKKILCELRYRGLEPYVCNSFPTNDSGISLGQIIFCLNNI